MRRANWISYGHNCHPFRMYGAEVGIFHETWPSMLLQPPAGILWHSLGSTRSYFPTSRAISLTSCEKGSFLIRSSVLFWNCQISWRATVPGWYFLVFLTFPAQRNSFWGPLPPMVGWSFLWTGSSPEADGPASTAIWANYWVGNNDGDLLTSSSCLTSSTHLSASSNVFSTSLVGEGFPAGDQWVHQRGRPPSLL